MDGQLPSLTFAWWNLHNFAHFDPERTSDRRWPTQPEHYESKRERVRVAFDELFGDRIPDLLGVCEITREAAEDLAAGLLPGFNIATAPTYPRGDAFQVAVFYRSDAGFSFETPVLPADADLPARTRPMIPIHLIIKGHVIRFVACHWTGLDEATSRLSRERLADALRRDSYAFLHPDVPTPGLARHIIVVGDLNEEPMSSVFEGGLIGGRDRASSHMRHWSDKDVRKARLYNAAWRYLGEQLAHGTPGLPAHGLAGTFFHDKHGWRTLDHVLVSSGLLGSNPPYFDESQTRIVSTPIMRDDRGRPKPFEPGKTAGVSDHLPLLGRLVLPETSE
jgi:endonuclease/exonuclease/phosphatase family metal-dependent hydrolase